MISIDKPTMVKEVQLTYAPDKDIPSRKKITTSADAHTTLLEAFDPQTIMFQEECIALYLNRSNKPIGFYRVSKGSLSGTVVDVRLILASAIKGLASGIILAHNHPSGNPQPSTCDLTLTKKIKDACKLMDVQLLDHIIINPFGGYTSFADRGIL